MLDMWVREEISASTTSIMDKWKKLQRMNQEQAMARYMALIKEWPGYGSTLFDVEVRTYEHSNYSLHCIGDDFIPEQWNHKYSITMLRQLM